MLIGMRGRSCKRVVLGWVMELYQDGWDECFVHISNVFCIYSWECWW